MRIRSGKLQDLRQTRIFVCLGNTLQPFESLRFIQAIFENGLKVGTDIFDVSLGVALPLQAHLIDAAVVGRASIRQHEGQDILYNFGTGGNHGMAANTTKLMNPGSPADIDVVPYHNMPGNGGVATHDEVVSNDAIVSHVAVG